MLRAGSRGLKEMLNVDETFKHEKAYILMISTFKSFLAYITGVFLLPRKSMSKLNITHDSRRVSRRATLMPYTRLEPPILSFLVM